RGRQLGRPNFGVILLGNVARYLAPQLAFNLKVRTAAFVRGHSRQPVALFGFVVIVRADGHDARVGPLRLTSLVKIDQCPRAAYLNLIFTASALPHAVHSNVRKSWSGSSEGSIRASCVSIPHLEQSGRYN